MSATVFGAREELSLDNGWRFHLGDLTMPVIQGHGPTYANAKAGQAWGAAAPDFDDSDWRMLDLPHDWVVEGPFQKEANISQGYRPRGVAWYRRHFRLAESDRGRHLELRFDGIATHATVWVNGILAHRNFCGYTPFLIDLTPIANYGDRLNTIAVRVDAEAQEGWWYEGGGIYRNTWLVKRPPVHLQTYGVFAAPERDAQGRWVVPVQATVDNIEKTPVPVAIRAELLDDYGQAIASTKTQLTAPSLQSEMVRMVVKVPGRPRLWSPESPALYGVRVTMERDGCSVDSVRVPCGFRTIRFDPAKGFFLNDRPYKIQGTCNHQDHAGVGVAVPTALWDFRIRRLKELGSNAYRCAHHPPAPGFLDACDRLGMLVMDENRNFNPTPEYLGQLRAMLLRDRNHPSVFLWSVFNEEPMQGTAQGREMARRMVAEVRRLDPTRPVTAAMNGGMDAAEGVFEAVDVIGFNYCDRSYDSFHEKHPNLPMISSEDTSAFMTRGEFITDPQRNVIASYDEEHARWGRSHRKAWQLIAERPFLAGGFVWTGFDYRGEPQRLLWPSVSSIFGILDTCGFPKTAAFIRQAEWVRDRPILAIAPHWNWPGKEGQPIRVIVALNGDSAELFLNGSSLGRKERPAFDYLQWEVPYAPGRLEAVSYRAGAEHARATVETTGEASAITLVPDRTSMDGDGRDTVPITVSVVDSQGRVVPRSSQGIIFKVTGPGENIGHGNGDHNSHEPEHGPCRRVFHGLAQLLVRSHLSSGPLTVRAESPGLRPAEMNIEVRATPAPPAIPSAEPVFAVTRWRAGPAQVERPDPATRMSNADMNTWAPANPGSLQTAEDGQWVLYRAEFTPWRALSKRGGLVTFPSIHGGCEVWLDGIKLAEKPESSPQPICVDLSPGKGGRLFTLLFHRPYQGRIGLGGAVTISPKSDSSNPKP
jgi:beta-galactosidase